MKKPVAKPMKPTATLVKKRSLLVPILAVVLLLIATAVVFFVVQQEPEGTVLATVNGEPIYLEQVQAEYARIPAQYQGQITQAFILNQTIDKTLLLQEADRRGITVDDDAVEKQITDIRDQFGIGEEDLKTLLSSQNMTLEDYRELVREELVLAKVVDEAVLRRVSVNDQEVITYYEQNQEEFSAPADGAVFRHILVENRSTAEELIDQLADGASFEKLAEQHSIDSSAPDGGYLGIITDESLVVDEFKEAAMRLREGQYTRSPVQTRFGYHIIMSVGKVEPYREVRDRIRQQLETEKQKAAFQKFVDELRSSADIKYYRSDATVTERRQARSDMSGFTSCVAEKAALYGTDWSQFTQEQLLLFGDQAESLVYVDCDEKPQLCSSANIQKYPTWVIGGEQYGKLSLKDLASRTGCELPQ